MSETVQPPESEPLPLPKSSHSPAAKQVHQCGACFTIYDPVIGDSEAGIDAGVGWEAVPADYCCNVCGAGKMAFQPMKLQASTIEL